MNWVDFLTAPNPMLQIGAAGGLVFTLVAATTARLAGKVDEDRYLSTMVFVFLTIAGLLVFLFFQHAIKG